MIRKIFSFLLTVSLCSTIAIIASGWLLQAAQNNGSTITVLATVRPQRIIVVDKNLEIIQLISNTAQNVRPIVLLDSIDGAEIPYSESIVEQYITLKPSLDFSQPGVVFDHADIGIFALMRKFLFR